MEHVLIKGDYVLTETKNAFNDASSFWLTKKNMTVALYCFSAIGEKEKEIMMKEIDSYIKYFQEKYEKDMYNPFRKAVAYLIYLLEAERKQKIGINELRRIGLTHSIYETLKEEYKHLEE